MAHRIVDLLIIGAGPYGLAMAAQAYRDGLDYLIVGDTMSFWRVHMPAGMFLRSACDWHLDPANVHTIDAYLEHLGLSPRDVEPLSLDFYLGYAEWFRRINAIEPLADHVMQLDQELGGQYRAHLASGDVVSARRVVIALGFGAFQHISDDLASILPPGTYGHTCEEVDLGSLSGKRVLIVGGRQSAYEWAALLHEAGVSDTYIVHRHPAPVFAHADWSWVGPLVDKTISTPGWYRRLADVAKDEIVRHLYAEGRLKLEPWLRDRIEQQGIAIWENTHVVSCVHREDGDVCATLANGENICVDRVILATGYKVLIERLPLLMTGNILPHLQTHSGFPLLSESFETNLSGLYITSLPATRDFGPFFGFTIAARASVRVTGNSLIAPSPKSWADR